MFKDADIKKQALVNVKQLRTGKKKESWISDLKNSNGKIPKRINSALNARGRHTKY